MKLHEISFRPAADHEPITVSAPLPETVSEAVKIYGEENTLALITRAAIVDIQSSDRAMFNRAENPVKDPAAISKENEKYRPGVRQQRQSAVEKLRATVSKLTPEERRQLLAAMQGDAKQKEHARA